MTLKIGDIPSGVQSVSINAVSNSSDTYTTGGTYAVSNLRGAATVSILYDELSDYHEYAGYGTLDNDSEPFKVYLNGTELANTTSRQKTLDGGLETNAILFSFTAGTTIDSDTIEITFENAPKKIAQTDLRLKDEAGYSYIVFGDICDNINVNMMEGTPYDEDGNYHNLPSVAYNNYYVRPNTETLFWAQANNGYYFADTSVFKVGDTTLTKKTWANGAYSGNDFFTSEVTSPEADGGVLTISGGTVTAYADPYKGNTFTASGDAIKKDDDSADLASVTLVFGTDGTATLTADSTEYKCTYYMTSDTDCSLGVWLTELSTNGCSIELKDNSYELRLHLGENATQGYTIMLTKS